MMINYSGLTKLRTKQVLFDEAFAVCDSNSLELLKDMSSKRRAIQEAIDEGSSVTEAIAREMSGGLTSRCEQDIQKLEMYLPLLETLFGEVSSNVVNPSMAHWISRLKLRWTSALTSSSILQCNRGKYYQIDDLRFEHGMVLFLYGAMLRDMARKNLQKDLVQSGSLFRKASGVYEHLAQKVLPLLVLSMAEKPPESVPNVASVMSKICLAEAQAATARKAEEKETSPSLLAKLHFGVAEFLDEASQILHSSRKECKNISSRLADFIAMAQALHSLRGHRYLAESLKNEGKIGEAIGVLNQSKKDAEKISPREDSSRVVLKQLIKEVTELKRKYDHENEFVWHEKIPSQFSLPSPEPVKVATAVGYKPQRLERSLHFKK